MQGSDANRGYRGYQLLYGSRWALLPPEFDRTSTIPFTRRFAASSTSSNFATQSAFSVIGSAGIARRKLPSTRSFNDCGGRSFLSVYSSIALLIAGRSSFNTDSRAWRTVYLHTALDWTITTKIKNNVAKASIPIAVRFLELPLRFHRRTILSRPGVFEFLKRSTRRNKLFGDRQRIRPEFFFQLQHHGKIFAW